MQKKNLMPLTTRLERYILFNKHNIKFNEKINRDIHIYNNKLKLHKKIDNCPICLVNNIECIRMICFGHYMCIDCYPKLSNNSCPVCRL